MAVPSQQRLSDLAKDLQHAESLVSLAACLNNLKSGVWDLWDEDNRDSLLL